MAFALHSPRKMRKAVHAYAKWQQAAAITPAAAPTWKMNRLQRKKAANAVKVALRQTQLGAIIAAKVAVRGARPAWRKWTPIINWKERRQNRKIASTQAKGIVIDAQLQATTEIKKQKLTAKAQKKEVKYRKRENAFTEKAEKKQRALTNYLEGIQHQYSSSIYIHLRPAQQAQLNQWFTDAIAHIGTLESSIALTQCQEQLREMIQRIHAGDYRHAAAAMRLIMRINDP